MLEAPSETSSCETAIAEAKRLTETSFEADPRLTTFGIGVFEER